MESAAKIRFTSARNFLPREAQEELYLEDVMRGER
jgi:hypothetical protein